MHSPLLVLQYRLPSEAVHRTVGDWQATYTCLMPGVAALPAESCMSSIALMLWEKLQRMSEHKALTTWQ